MSATDQPLRVLAFEPFDGGSHRAVRESIQRHSHHRWTWFTRPARAWKWRMRLAAAELAEQVERAETAAEADPTNQTPDCLFTTSLLAAGDLRALLPARLRGTPLVLYMHENQAAYPVGHQADHPAEFDVQFVLTNLTSILAADLVIWNSRWNRDSFTDGVQKVLRHAPDLQLSDVAGQLTSRDRNRLPKRDLVIWPPVESPPFQPARPVTTPTSSGESDQPVRVVWPHRWEHDKGPDELLSLAREHTMSLGLRWTILGEQFRRTPPELEQFATEFRDHIDHIGFEPDRTRYWQRLSDCDWVLSTARHEFFGVAVVEAMLAGCLPWLPARLSYPELLPEVARGLGPDRPPAPVESLRRAILDHLRPALAANAVATLDHALARTVRRTPV